MNNLKPHEIKVANINDSNDSTEVCKVCNGTGYNGRIGAYEYLPITREIKSALRDKKNEKEIESTAIEAGMLTLEAYGLELVKGELTTINEIMRVCKN